jgi:hypothetical protein
MNKLTKLIYEIIVTCEKNIGNLESLLDKVIGTEYGRYVIVSIDYPMNAEYDSNDKEDSELYPIGKLDILIIFTPLEGKSFYINLIKDYNVFTEEFEGGFYVKDVDGLEFTHETVDNYGNE